MLTFLAKNTSAIVTAMSKNDKAYLDGKTLKTINYYIVITSIGTGSRRVLIDGTGLQSRTN